MYPLPIPLVTLTLRPSSMQRAQLVLRVRRNERSFPPPPPRCLLHSAFLLVLHLSSQICLFSSVTKLLSSHRLSSVTQLTLTNRPPSIPRLSPVHHMQPDASCEAVASFLSCFAFDDYELTCSTTSPRPCSFPFDSLRALSLCAHATASFSLHSTSFISLFRLICFRIIVCFSLLSSHLTLTFFSLFLNSIQFYFILNCIAPRVY